MTDRRQRQKEQRTQKREDERRAATRREFRRRIIIAIGVGIGLAAILVLINLGPGEQQLPPGYAGFRNQPTACGADQPPEWSPQTFAAPEDQDVQPTTATIETSCGPIVIALNQDAPETVNSFVFLGRMGFYEGLVFNRIIDNFAMYGGDSNADGTGTPGYVLTDEPPEEGFEYAEGVVAMSNSGGGTGGSHFFIVIGPDARVLTNTFSVLGTVTEGQDTIDEIVSIPRSPAIGSNERSRPTETVYIESVTFSD
ncbi:MAG: peptidylprolyl isomerase [Acidimicrobiia bacterium]